MCTEPAVATEQSDANNQLVYIFSRNYNQTNNYDTGSPESVVSGGTTHRLAHMTQRIGLNVTNTAQRSLLRCENIVTAAETRNGLFASFREN